MTAHSRGGAAADGEVMTEATQVDNFEDQTPTKRVTTKIPPQGSTGGPATS